MSLSPSTIARGSIVPLRVGRVLLLLLWLAVLYGTAVAVPHLAGVRSIGAWAAALVFLTTFTVAIERSIAVQLLPVSGLAGVAMQYCVPSNAAFVAVVAVIAVVAIRLDTTRGRRVAAFTAGGFLLASAVAPHPLSASTVVSMVPGLLFAYLGSAALQRLRAEQQRTQELLEEVVAGRDAVIRAAALDERAHLARELHDVLAHTLSALSIHLEGARMLAAQRSCDPAVVQALERTSGLAREGLGEARRAVGSLKGEFLPGPDLLPQLAGEFERDSGVPCRLHIEGTPVELVAAARLAIYRIVQEALTNVRKHSHASSVAVTLRYGLDEIELVVENEGIARSSPLPGGGYGVGGMRERARLLSGRLEAGPTQTGFKVLVWIPREQSGPSAS